jgi:UDP-glucose 4-epimerase
LTKNLRHINFKKIDCLVHLASQTGVIQSMKSPEKDAEENIFKSIKFFEFLKNKGLKKIIYASSMGVLGDNLFSSNKSRHNPLNFYAASKASMENYLNVYCKTFGIKSYILRFSNIYGKYSRFKTSVVASFIKSILKNDKIVVNGSGKQYRDFLFVEDLVEVIDKIIFIKNNNNFYKNPIHVASGKSITINDLVKLFKNELKLKFRIVKKNKNKGDIQKSFVKINEIKKMKKDFTNIKKGIKITLNWYKNSF